MVTRKLAAKMQMQRANAVRNGAAVTAEPAGDGVTDRLRHQTATVQLLLRIGAAQVEWTPEALRRLIGEDLVEIGGGIRRGSTKFLLASTRRHGVAGMETIRRWDTRCRRPAP